MEKKRMYGKIVNNHEGVKIFYEEGKNEDEGEQIITIKLSGLDLQFKL